MPPNMLAPSAASQRATLKCLLQRQASVARQQLLAAHSLQVKTVPQVQSLHCRVEEGLQALFLRTADAQPRARLAPPPT